MKSKKVLVTVGTTKFDKLINTVSSKETLDKLLSLGYSSIIFQIGNGNANETIHPILNLTYIPFIEAFNEAVQECDLIISHAGAGTCIDVLTNRKPLIVVINEDLMDNHQLELGEQLAKDGYLYKCTCATLLQTLDKDLRKLKMFPIGENKQFGHFLDKQMGFE